MSVAQPADPRDVQDFQFKLLCRLRIFTGQDGTFISAVNLVATASKYGLLFVGSPSGFQVITSSSIVGLEHRSSGEISNYPRREMPLPSNPSHLSVSCDQNFLAVALKKNECAHAIIYSVPSFIAKDITVLNEVRLSSKVDTSILELTWNPGIPNILAACLSDGSMMAYELKSPGGVDISSLPPATQATCFCWSPKGKQLVVGSEVGTLAQYKPDLKIVKTFSPPNLGSGNVAVVNVLWLSNYQFAAVYRDKINTEERPGLLIVNAPKSGALSFVNYEDICYSGGELRSPQFYLIHQPVWNILMVASANSMEVGVMGLQEDQISWEQWTQEDAARAELPLSADKQETFPVGLGLDTSTQHDLPWGENQSLPPMPVLHILSHQGVLCLFYAVNLRAEAARICSPPEKLPDESGLALFTTASATGLPSPAILEQPALQSGAVLTSVDPGFSSSPANKLESANISKPQNTFGFGSALSGTSSTGFGSALPTQTTPAFGGALPGYSAPKSTPSLTGLGLSFGAAPVPAFSTATTTQPPTGFSTPAPATKPPSFSFLSAPVTTNAANLKLTAPTQAAANFTFTAPTITSTPIMQQAPKPVAAPLLQSMPVKPAATVAATPNFQMSSSLPAVQPLEQTVTITKVPAMLPKTEAPVVEPKQPLPAPKPAVSNTVFYNAINEEVVHFGRELAELRTRISGVKVQVGTEDEKRNLCQKVEVMDEFWRELKDTTQALSSEIRSLKSVLMEAFAWTEESKSRSQQLSSPMYMQLARSQGLDPVSARCAASIKDLVYYVENQLRQVNERLDHNWLEFQDSCKPTLKNKMHIPSLESVYQAMVVQNNILNKQRAIMADIAHRVQEKGRKTQIPLISSAVLARVRDKEAGQMVTGETELSRLAENLVKMKLGAADVQVMSSQRCRRLSRKKESVLRGVLSQCTVTRVCPTKPFRATTGGISTGKPVVSRVMESIPIKDTPKLTAGIAITDHKTTSILAAASSSRPDPSPPQPSLFMFAQPKPVEPDSATKSFISRGFSAVGTNPGLVSKEIPAATTAVASGGMFTLPVDSGKVKPNIIDNALGKVSNSSEVSSKSSAAEFSFTNPLQSGKSSTVGNFSFGMALSKTPSVGKLSEASKRLEDYYEDLTPPGSPEHSVKETVASTVGSSFTFSFTPSKPSVTGTLNPTSTPLQKSPLVSLDSIVAGIGNGSSPPKSAIKAALLDKPVPSTTGSSTTFSFGSLSLGHPQQGISMLGKGDEPKKPTETFTFSLGTSFNSSAATSLPSITPAADAPKSPAVNLKTPFLTAFGTQNTQGSSPPQTNIFGGGDSQKQPTPPSQATSSSTNIFSQTTPMFGSLATGSGSIFGAIPTTTTTSATPTLTFGKQSADSSQSVIAKLLSESPQQKETLPKDQAVTVTAATTTSAVIATSAASAVTTTAATSTTATTAITTTTTSENVFSQSASLFGSLSMGLSISSTKPVGNIFGGSTNFSFSKPLENPEENKTLQAVPDVTENQEKESESPLKETPPAASNMPTPSLFGQLNSPTDKPETTEAQTVPATSVFGATTALNFSQTKPLFGAVTTTPATTTTTPAAVTTTATTTISATSTTFSFSLPTTSAPFSQKTSFFGQPASSTTTPVITSSSSFFGQSICSPSSFGQSGGNVFGQPAATAAPKTNIFGQAAAAATAATTTTTTTTTSTTTTTPSLFGQVTTTTSQSIFGQAASPTTSLFGQATATGSLFGGNTTGGFGSKPTFGQSGGSIFGQAGSTGFGTSGGSIFGGGGCSGGSIFGGGGGGGGGASTAPAGNLFQSSTGSSIFGGTTSPSTGGTTGGAFSSGLGQSISQSGFGSPTAFQSKPGGFGGSPVFDRGTTGFGSPPTFGGAPTFGGSPTFGSPGKVFGGSSPTVAVGFGTGTTQQSSTFESLASQNTMSFGNLAQTQSQGFGTQSQPVFGGQTQQQQQPQQQQSSTFGGSSFSSWR